MPFILYKSIRTSCGVRRVFIFVGSYTNIRTTRCKSWSGWVVGGGWWVVGGGRGGG